MDPDTVSPPADAAPGATPTAEPDLDAIGADLAAIETALDDLAAGTYRHDEREPPAS